MGASASKSKTLTNNYGNGFTLTASFNENSTNTANNTSNITCTATFSAGGANWETSYASTLIIYWHDTRENYDRQVASINFSGIAKNSSKTASGTINVTHKDGGDLSGYAYAVFTKGSTTTGWACNSGNVATNNTALTQINRYAVTNSVSGSDIEGNFSVNYTKYINTYQYKLRISLPTIVLLERIDYNTSGATFTLTQQTINDIFSRYTNTSTFDLGFRVETWDSTGSNMLSAGNEKIITAQITNALPTFNVAYLDTNSTTTAITQDNQVIIRNNSTLQINVTNATAYKGATLTSITVNINGTIYNGTLNNGSATFNIGTINVSSNTTAVVTLTDSRGFKTIKNLSIQVLDWQLPTAIITLQRENNFYSETNINVNAEYSSLDNKNTITIKARYKKVSDSTYGSYTTLQDNVTTQFTLDNNYAWNIQVLVQDLLGSTTYNLELDRGIPITFFDRALRSVGINCFPADAESLEVSGENILNRIAGYGQIAKQVVGDWNTVCGTASGFYMGNGLSHSPSGTTVDNWWWVIHLVHNDLYQRQIAFSFLNNSQIFTRIMNNGTWNNWTSLTSQNTTLWTNPNPKSSFAPQNITLASDDYDHLKIYYYDFVEGSRERTCTVEIPKLEAGEKAFIHSNFTSTTNNMYVASRTITFNSDTSLAIDSNYGSNVNGVREAVNTVNVPYKIVGFKEH